MDKKPAEFLIAHRGIQHRYPENTMLSIRAALESAVRYVEVDVQFSKDGEPVLYHDATLWRVSKRQGKVTDFSFDDLVQMPAYEPDRFKDDFIKSKIAPLQLLNAFCLKYDEAHFFVELKEEAITAQGEDYCLAKIALTLAEYIDRITLISFSESAVMKAKRDFHFMSTGIVLKDATNAHSLCEQLSVDVAFINYQKLNPQKILKLPCPLAIYEIPDTEQAKRWLNAGVDMIESFKADDILVDLT